MRIVFKVSGEALGNGKESIDLLKFNQICNCIERLFNVGIEVVVVPGGGNIWRGRNGSEIDRITSDFIGMASTLVNAYTLENLLQQKKVNVRLLSGLSKEKIEDYDILNPNLLSKVNNNAKLIRILPKMEIENYNNLKARKYLENKEVVIIGGGIGVSGFTTDMTVVLSAIDLSADFLLFGKSAKGVYNKDPNVYFDAEFLPKVTHYEILKNQIKVGVDKMGIMDAPAMAKLVEEPITTFVFDIRNAQTIDAIVNILIEYYNNMDQIKEIPGTIIETNNHQKILQRN